MVVAFILINSEAGFEGEVLEMLKKIDAVKEAYRVYGVYDIIAKVETETLDELRNAVTRKIRCIDRIMSLTVMLSEEAM